MATLCKTFPGLEPAVHSAEALRVAGVPAGDIGVLIGSHYHDVRAERAGGFGGPVDPDAPFGKYAGPPRPRWRAAGGFTPRADAQRQGSYADVERTLSVTPDDDHRHIHVTDGNTARRRMRQAGVPDDVVRRMVRHLHEGEAVMFVQLAHVDLSTAEALIDHSGVAA